MKIFNRLFRLMRINFVLMRYNIDEIILGEYWFFPLRVLIFLNPYYWFQDKTLTRGERIRMALEELGPIFVKAGQIISTRRDILPDDISDELAKLQDRVPPFPGKQARKIVEKALGKKIHEVFSEFDATPLASASIAQVHGAKLLSGESVAVKVLRPGIDEMIIRDVDLLMTFAGLAQRYSSRAKHLKPLLIVNEIAQTLHDELDLMREASNASQLKRNFANSELLHIPKIYWEYCRRNIIVMERIYGIPIHDIERLHQSGVNMRVLAERCIEVFFTQVFRDSFFHADLHPGNLFACVKDPENPSFIAVDFGIVGSLSHNDKKYIAENMVAFFKRDYQRVAELHISCGWLPPDTRIDQFEGAIRAVSEPIFEQPLRDISFGKLLLRLFQVARQFHINIQPQLILLQKTLVSIEGLSRRLAPELDLWKSATPQIERWLKRQVGVRGLARRLRENLPLWSEQLPEIPSLVYEILQETKHEKEAARFAKMQNEINHQSGRLNYFIAGVLATLASSALIALLFKYV